MRGGWRWWRAVLAVLVTVCVVVPLSAAVRPGIPAPAPARIAADAPLTARYAAHRANAAEAARTAHEAGAERRAAALRALAEPGRRFLEFDARGSGSSAEVLGDPRTAERVTILVPGSDTGFDTYERFRRGALALHQRLGGVSPSYWTYLGDSAVRRWGYLPALGAPPSGSWGGAESLGERGWGHLPAGGWGSVAGPQRSGRHPLGPRVAVIAWLGYPTLGTVSPEAITLDRAHTGASELRAFVADLTSYGIDARTPVSLLCHSYGSVVWAQAAHGLATRTSGPRVTDIALYGSPGTGFDRVAADGTSVKVLVLTTFDLDEYVYEALRAGASGFLLKDASADQLADAVRVVAAGDALLAPGITRRLITEFARLGAPRAPTKERLAGLTERETEVLALIAQGLSNAEIAAQLVVAEQTVKTHVGRILVKLGLRDRTQAAVFAYESGLVRPSVN